MLTDTVHKGLSERHVLVSEGFKAHGAELLQSVAVLGVGGAEAQDAAAGRICRGIGVLGSGLIPGPEYVAVAWRREYLVRWWGHLGRFHGNKISYSENPHASFNHGQIEVACLGIFHQQLAS